MDPPSRLRCFSLARTSGLRGCVWGGHARICNGIGPWPDLWCMLPWGRHTYAPAVVALMLAAYSATAASFTAAIADVDAQARAAAQNARLCVLARASVPPAARCTPTGSLPRAPPRTCCRLCGCRAPSCGRRRCAAKAKQSAFGMRPAASLGCSGACWRGTSY